MNFHMTMFLVPMHLDSVSVSNLQSRTDFARAVDLADAVEEKEEFAEGGATAEEVTEAISEVRDCDSDLRAVLEGFSVATT